MYRSLNFKDDETVFMVMSFERGVWVAAAMRFPISGVCEREWPVQREPQSASCPSIFDRIGNRSGTEEEIKKWFAYHMRLCLAVVSLLRAVGAVRAVACMRGPEVRWDSF